MLNNSITGSSLTAAGNVKENINTTNNINKNMGSSSLELDNENNLNKSISLLTNGKEMPLIKKLHLLNQLEMLLDIVVRCVYCNVDIYIITLQIIYIVIVYLSLLPIKCKMKHKYIYCMQC